MSGNLNYRSYAPWGVWGTFRENAIKPGDPTLGTVTRDAGYATGFIGKWHLGGDFLDAETGKLFRSYKRLGPGFTVDASRIVGGGPRSLGFGYSFTLPCGIQGPVYLAYENGSWFPLGEDSEIVYLNKENAINPRYVSDKGPGPGDSNWKTEDIGKLISKKAVDFINEHAGGEPFFLCYWSPTVHVPHCPPEEFDGQKIAGTTPSAHLDMIRDLDHQVARIVSALKANGVYDETLILFTSDNGGLHQNAAAAQAGHDSSGRWRGYKNAPHEGGHRVPYIATWKSKIAAGQTTDQLVANHDTLATLAALVGTDVPNNHARDSLNLLPLLTGEGRFRPRPYLMLQGGSRHEVIYREGDWKLILQSDPRVTKFEPIALFDLGENPEEAEERNLVNAPEQQERVRAMRASYVRIRGEWRADGDRPRPLIISSPEGSQRSKNPPRRPHRVRPPTDLPRCSSQRK